MSPPGTVFRYMPTCPSDLASARGRHDKLRPIAERIAAMLEERFGEQVSFLLETEKEWLPSVPDRRVHRAHWQALSRVYSLLVDGRWELDARLEECRDQLRSGVQRVDAWFETPYSFILEFDEGQHFNPFRLLTLENFPGYRDYSFDFGHYVGLCRSHSALPGTTGFERLKSFDPLFPPLLEGEAQDNRIRQRAFRDFLKDVTPAVVDGLNPTIRISYQITSGKRGHFEEDDVAGVERHLVENGFLDRIELGQIRIPDG